MKKYLLLLFILGSFVAVLPAKAGVFWYDTITNLPLGCITTNPPSANLTVTNFSNWYPHAPGSSFAGTPYDMLVVSNFYTSGAAVTSRHLRVNGLNSEYIMRLFDPVNTNTFSTGNGTILYASFVANANFVPSAGVGTYFATFNSADAADPPTTVTNGFEFRGRVFQIGQTNVYPFTNRVASTYRFGVANALNDPSRSGGNLSQTLFVPIDLKGNIDYQVVLKYDIDNATASLWVNPASESDTSNMAGPTSDPGAVTAGLAGLLFRQISPGGTIDVRDIAVGTNFADVVTNVLADTVVQVATNFNTVTNFSGNPALLEVFASSIGGGPLSYQWYQIVGGVTNSVGGNSQTYVVSQTSGTDTGNYFCAVTNSGGIGALSRTNFYISVSATLTGLSFGTQPVNKGGSVGGSLTETCTVNGTGPLTFQWNFNGNPLTDGQPVTSVPGDASVVSGSLSPTLTVTGLSTNETGNFTVTATTTAAVVPNSVTSTNAAVTVLPPQPKTIAFLRSLLDKTSWQATDTSSTFSIAGINCTVTNVTSSLTSSYYIQDSTAGINLFITGDSSFRPQRGDVIVAVGTLSSFNNSLELACNAANPYQSYKVVAPADYNTLPAWALTNLPAPFVFNPILTNNAGLMETNLESRFAMLTNVYFPSTGLATYPSGATITVTNASGVPFLIFISSQCTNVVGQTIPPFAWSVLGVLSQSKSGAYSSAGYELLLTSPDDVVTPAPEPVSSTIAMSGTSNVLTWTAVPYNYSYSVLVAVDINGPYAPLATGLTFTNSNGIFTDNGNVYSASLYGTNENPVNASTAIGSGFVTLTPDEGTIYVNESWSGLSTAETASHIHGPAAPGVNASVLFPFAPVIGTTTGSIPQQSFAITPTQVGYLRTGMLYMNVHSTMFGGGEIRGQLYPATTKFYKITSP